MRDNIESSKIESLIPRQLIADAGGLIEFLKEYVDAGVSPICGNTIGQDRRFLVKYMPELEAYFHYRNLDVSTLKELALRWNPKVLAGFSKKNTHLALDDIRESIDELKHFRKKFLVV